MTRSYVGLGANLGPREVTLRRAVDLLAAANAVEVVAVSPSARPGLSWMTRGAVQWLGPPTSSSLCGSSAFGSPAPVGVVDQPSFLNGAVAIETSLTPRELLDLLLETERALGRVRGERWGPRTVDLDLLVYGDETIDEPGLRVPHPRLAGRRFALEPLADLDPGLELPGLGNVSAALAALD